MRFWLVLCVACSPAAQPTRVAPAPVHDKLPFGVADWLVGAPKSPCATRQHIEYPNDPMGGEDLYMQCDATGAVFRYADLHAHEDGTTIYPVDVATFDAVWQSALAHVSPPSCLTREEAVPSTKRLEDYQKLWAAPHATGFSLGYTDASVSRDLACASSPAWDATVLMLRQTLARLRARNPGPLPLCTSMNQQRPPCVERADW